jgi:hypothetical protein
MFQDAELGELIAANTSVVWHGEDRFDYRIWVYRVATPIPNQLDGFENRIQCSACDKYFWLGHSKEENCCPYCDQPIVVRSSRDHT